MITRRTLLKSIVALAGTALVAPKLLFAEKSAVIPLAPMELGRIESFRIIKSADLNEMHQELHKHIRKPTNGNYINPGRFHVSWKAHTRSVSLNREWVRRRI